MLLDAQNQFAKDQVVTATAASTNVIDLGIGRSLGSGEPLYLVVDVTESMTDASSNSTVTPSLRTDDNAAMSSATVIRTLETIPALTAAGYRRIYAIEPRTLERYIDINWTVANGDLSTGKFSAYLVQGVQDVANYASGYSVL